MSIYGRYGIITAHLIDPLYQIINKISGGCDNDYNSIGFYYINNLNQYVVILLDIYDACPIYWMHNDYPMHKILISPFISKINCYQIIDNNLLSTENSKTSHIFNNSILSLSFQGKKDPDLFLPTENSKTIQKRSVLEEYFQRLVKKIVNSINNKNYSSLLLKFITNENKSIMGYNLVNKVLLKLMGKKNIMDNQLHKSIISHHLLKNPVTVSVSVNDIDINTKFIIDKCQCEINKFMTSFTQLFITHKIFRANILDVKLNIPQIITETINTEIINTETTNKKSINVDINHINDLGTQINNIISLIVQSKDIEQNIIIKNIILSYNNIIHGTNITKLEVPETNDIPIHLVQSNNRSQLDLINSNYLNSNNISLSINDNNLTSISNEKLLDTLIYIDSMRDTNGIADNKFYHLQNEITYELAKRRQ